jgi:hypothetical protein
MTLSKMLKKAVIEELKDCRKWYRKTLEEDRNEKLTTLEQIDEAMNDMEANDEYENILFSNGYILGMRQAIRTVEAWEQQGGL